MAVVPSEVLVVVAADVVVVVMWLALSPPLLHFWRWLG